MARNGGFAGGVRTTRVLERIRASVGQGDEKRRQVLAVPCPKCGVKESKSCTGKGDQLRWAFHAERRKAAAMAAAAASGAAAARRTAAVAAPARPAQVRDEDAERRWAWIREQMIPEQLVPVEGASRAAADRDVASGRATDRGATSQAARAVMAAQALRDR